jgi:soluble lytic murein transglycosylase-like protein
MLPRFAASAFAVAVIAGVTVCVQPAAATETPASAQNYASILRTINPQLQQHQSLRYARSLLVDSHRSNLDPNLIMALVTVESSWKPAAVSHSGARGLGQLMPMTAARLGVNPRDPSQNLRGAATYLRSLINRFAGRGVDTMRYAIGAYNAGPLAVERFRGIPPYHETQRYVVKVLTQWHSLSVRVAKAFADSVQDAPPAPAEATEAQWLPHSASSALAVTMPVDAAATDVSAPAATETP